MGSVGKNPHRPEGKAKADNEHMQAAWMNEGPPHDPSHNDKARAQLNRETKDRGSFTPAEEQVGGSRPGVESRVKDAIERRDLRPEPQRGRAAARPEEREEES